MNRYLNNEIINSGKEALKVEAEALLSLKDSLDFTFEQTVNLILSTRGRLIVSGVGKSGHVGKKIAASFASTGTPAFFVHAAEAGHGDIGMITSDDLLLLISHSGESDEVVNLADMARRNNTVVISMVGFLSSTLAKASNLSLHCHIAKEACPLGVAPTTSTIVQMAMGDALTIATMKSRGFTREDFGRTHPLGTLGRKLYLKVQDVMLTLDRVPHLPGNTPLIQAVTEMATSRIGAVVVMSEERLAGIFTDADLRKLLVNSRNNLNIFSELTLEQVTNLAPLTIDINELASQALLIFEKRHVSRIICLDEGKPKGLLSLFNLLDSKVVS